MAIWIPMQMHNDTMFAERINRIRTVRIFDYARSQLRNVIKDNVNQLTTQEAQIILDELDRIAQYLHTEDNSKLISQEQVKLVKTQLDILNTHYARLRTGKPLIQPIEINTSNAITKIAEEGL